MARNVIINGDDFGLSAGVSRGILEAYKKGVLTSTTFMVNFPWADQMAGLLTEAPGLGVGIHLNITTGRPVLHCSQVPSLVTAEGQFLKSPLHLVWRANKREVLAEWSAQVEKGIELLGRLPTHLDTHHYVQVYPGYQQAMIEVAQRYRISAIRCLYPGPGLDTSTMFPAWAPVKRLVRGAIVRAANVVAKSGLQRPSATIAGNFDLHRLLSLIERVDDGTTELVCHPGRVDDQLCSLSSLRGQRELELHALTASEVKERMAALGIRLIHFGHLRAM